MDKHIKIYRRDGKYCFSVNKFSSLRHHGLTKFAKENYRYAWEAQKDARELAKNHDYHLKVLEKFAIEDLSKPIMEDVSSERMLADHYDEIYDSLVDVASGMEEGDKNQRKVNYFEAKAVVKEILFIIEQMPSDEVADEEEKSESETRLHGIIKKIKKLVHKYYLQELKDDEKKSKEAPPAPPMGDMGEMGEMPPMDLGESPMGGEMPMGGGMGGGMPMASSKSLIKVAKSLSSYEETLDEVDAEAIESLLSEYAERACGAIENKHSGCTWTKCSSGIRIMDDNEDILFLDVGKDLFLENIRPSGSLEKMYPYPSDKFYQSYWKPIAERIGHCCIGDNSSVLDLSNKILPDIGNKDCECGLFEAIHKDSKRISPFTVSFRGDPSSWFFKEKKLEKSASSRYTEEDYYKNGKGAIVICTDPELKSYYNKTGQVVQVIPFGDHLEVDVDFIGNVFRMIESQFEIVDGI